ncbi:MAG: hypothetical protein ACRBN8_28110 [Nannocystales bacterium]
MNERRLLILAAVGASVVAYVVYALLSRNVAAPPESEPTRPGAGAVEAAREEPKEKRRPRMPAKKAVLPGKPSVAPPPGGPPPPLPMPDISLDEAREDYSDLLAELERELQRNKDTGKALANKHWVEYYRRGHEVMTPLRRYLSIGSEEGKTEVAGMDEELRDIMGKLQTDPADLEEDRPKLEENPAEP